MAHSGKRPEDLPIPVVGHGHPMDPNRDKLLSADDEKRIDEEGRPVAIGELWSNAKTGAYINIAVTYGTPTLASDKTMLGYAATGKNLDDRFIHVFCTVGKPKIFQKFVGAALELPSDLGRDAVKQKYVTEWVAATAAEALVKAGVQSIVGDPILQNQCASWVALSCNNAINRLGL